MKKYLVMSLLLGVSLLVLAGSVFATPVPVGPCVTCKAPEPGMLTLLSSGMAGIGLFSFIKRKNRK